MALEPDDLPVGAFDGIGGGAVVLVELLRVKVLGESEMVTHRLLRVGGMERTYDLNLYHATGFGITGSLWIAGPGELPGGALPCAAGPGGNSPIGLIK